MINISKSKIIYLLYIILALVVAVTVFRFTRNKISPQPSLAPTKTNEVINNVSLRIEQDGAKIPLNELLNGCPRKDCIPSIDSPKFETAKSADSWLEKEDRVFVLNFNDEIRVYPQRIMNWHEIVNDWYGEEPVAVTFCPLCGTAVALERRVDGKITQFGVSGKLHNSDLVMYDRYEGSLWQQVSGEAIMGPAARRNEVLNMLFLITLDWEKALEKYPDSKVLSRDTGFGRDYNHYPYNDYETSNRVGFGADSKDQRLHPKAWIYGIIVNQIAKAYPEKVLLKNSTLNDIVGGNTIVMNNQDGAISFFNQSTQEEIIPLRSFWFAWAAFNPNTLLYEKTN